MKKPIAIIAGEPNSISSEIIFKSWKLRKRYIHKPLLVIGSIQLLNLQKKRLKYHIRIKKIKSNFNMEDLNGNELPVYNVDYKQKKPFQKISNKSNKYIFKSFDIAIDLIKNKKILGFINCPVSKQTLFKNKYQGITEFLSKKASVEDNEVMLIYNKSLSVSPMTTHIPLKNVHKKITTSMIVYKIKTINQFYKDKFNKIPRFAVTGLNPHCESNFNNSEEDKIIKPAIKFAQKKFLNVKGPFSADTLFVKENLKKFDIIICMYHDQVLTPLKTLFGFNAINLTLGLPFIRISPDHGPNNQMLGQIKSNPASLKESLIFLKKINEN